MNKSYYDILEIQPDADEAKIKAAYRKLARKYHPDVNKSEEAIEKFKVVTIAYETLSNKAKRAAYDLHNGFSKRQKEQRTTSTERVHAQKAYSYNEKHSKSESRPQSTAEKDKNAFGTVFNDILEGLFTAEKKQAKSAPKQKPVPVNGLDINTSITISQRESIEGSKRTVNILHTSICPNCEGRKFINGAICPLCKGAGETSVQKKINVKIPPYVKNGSVIRLANEGNKGLHGGTDGDLFLTIKVKQDGFFTYDGSNAACEIPVTPFEAALGATIEIPTPDGTISMKIPPLSSSGQKFRLSGQGLGADLKNAGEKPGDLVVTIKIVLPRELSDKEKALYEQLKELSAHKIRENLPNDTKSKN